MLEVTAPSIMFSIGTNPRSTLPASTELSTSSIELKGWRCSRTKSSCVTSASSAKVPIGPRNPTERWLWVVKTIGPRTYPRPGCGTFRSCDDEAPCLPGLPFPTAGPHTGVLFVQCIH